MIWFLAKYIEGRTDTRTGSYSGIDAAFMGLILPVKFCLSSLNVQPLPWSSDGVWIMQGKAGSSKEHSVISIQVQYFKKFTGLKVDFFQENIGTNSH